MRVFAQLNQVRAPASAAPPSAYGRAPGAEMSSAHDDVLAKVRVFTPTNLMYHQTCYLLLISHAKYLTKRVFFSFERWLEENIVYYP